MEAFNGRVDAVRLYNVALSASEVLALYQGALSSDVVAPAVTTVTSPTPNGSYGVGSTIVLSVSFSEVVLVTGTPQLTLETGASDAAALYASGSGTATVTFTYTVGAGQTATDLDYVSAGALTLNGGTIRDAAGNAAVLMLPPPGAPGSLAANKALVVDTAATAQPIVMSLDFDAGAGTVAADSSGNGNNGTLLNGPVWTTGVTGSALQFDGSNDVVTVAGSASINTVTTQVTVAAWVYRTSAQASWAAVVSRQRGTANQEHYYLGFSNTGQYRWFVSTTTGYSSTALGGAAPVGQWVHVVGTYDGAMVRFYVNGVQQFATARTGTFAPDTTGLLIGAGSNDAAQTPVEAFNGRVDAVRVYNVALSASEVLALYQGTAQPIMRLDFDAGTGTVAADSSGNGNNGTLLNGPVWTTGVTGSALQFDGSNDVVTVAGSASINTVTTQVTVAAWVYRTAAQASWAAVVSRQRGTANQEHYYLGFSNTGQYRWFVNTTSGNSSTALGGAAPVGQWVHVVGTYDGAMVRFYVNGVQQFATARTGTFAPDTTGLLIGAGSNDAAQTPVEAFNGRVDAVRVYKVALSASQVLALYQGTLP